MVLHSFRNLEKEKWNKHLPILKFSSKEPDTHIISAMKCLHLNETQRGQKNSLQEYHLLSTRM
jgi:hypothetical protein